MNREISRYPVQPLYRFRVKTIIVGYDLCPNATLPEIVNQIQNAAKFVFEYAEKMNARYVKALFKKNDLLLKLKTAKIF